MGNPFDRFITADQALDPKRIAREEEPHTDAWWARYLGLHHSNISRYRDGSRRIGWKHEQRVFKRLTAYWDADRRRWNPFRFSILEYRAAVPTASELRTKAKAARRRKAAKKRREQIALPAEQIETRPETTT